MAAAIRQPDSLASEALLTELERKRPRHDRRRQLHHVES